MKRKTTKQVPSESGQRFRYLSALVVAVGLLAYFGGISSAIQIWSRSPDEQHGFLVLPIALLLLYLKRDEFPTEAPRIDFRGCLLLVLAGGLRAYGDTYVRPWMEMWSLPIWIGGVVWLFGGWRIFRWALPSIAFLFFMAPMPGQMQTVAGYPLQIIAATGGGWLLQILGQPAFVSGTTILLGENVLDVERACAGLRMFQGMLAVSIAWSLFSRYSWRRLLSLFAIAPLVAIIVNILRIAVTGLLFQYISGDAAKSFTHDWAGILMIPTGAIVYFCIDTVIDRLRAWNRQYPERWLFTASMATVGLVIVCFAGFTIQKRQQRAAIDLVLIQARELKSKDPENGSEAALKLYEQYVSARPDDAAVMSEFAEFNQKIGTNRWMTAAKYYEKAWRLDSTRVDDALHSMNLWKDCGAWKILTEKSDEIVPQLTGERRIEAIRLRTTAIARQSDSTIALAGIEKMLRGCLASSKEDYDYLEHTWQCARLTRLQTSGERNSDSMESVVADLPSDAIMRFPFDPVTSEQEKELRKTLGGSLAKALLLIDRWIATHPNEPMPLLYRVALLDEARSKLSGDLSTDSIQTSIDRAIGMAMELVEKSLANDDKKVDSMVCAKVYFIAGQRAMNEQPERAKELLNRCREIQPKGYQVYVLLDKLLQVDALDERIALFQDAIHHCGTNELAITLPLAEAYIASSKEAEAEKLLGDLESKIKRESPASLERSKIALMLASTKARGMEQLERRREAIDTLSKALRSQEVVAQRRNLAGLYARAQFQLGKLFRSVNQEDAATAAFSEGRRFDDGSIFGQLELARSSEKDGNYKAAIDQYRRVAKVIGNQEPSIYLSIAKCQLAQQNRAKPSMESLEAIRKMILDAKARGADGAAAVALIAESYVIAEDLPNALKAIEAQLKITPMSQDLLFSSAIIRRLSGDLAGALADVEKYRSAPGSKPSDRLLLKVMVLERDGELEDLEKASSEIETAAPQLKLEDLKAAKIHLALAYFQKGKTAQAIARIESLASTYIDDLPIQRLTAELFADAKEMESKLIEAEKNLMRIEGNDGMHWQATRAARLLRRKESDDVVEADRLISRLEQLYPAWARTHLLRGQINEQKGRLSQALESFRKAWELGLRDANLAIRLLSSLNQAGKYQEASDLIAQLEDLVPKSANLFDRTMPQLVQSKKSEYVLELAKRWFNETPNYENGVRLGETLMTIAKSKQKNTDLGSIEDSKEMLMQAAKVLDDSIAMEPNNPRAWIAAFQLQLQILRDRDAALVRLEQLSKQINMPPFWRSYVLARLYSEIGEDGRSGNYFEETIRLAKMESDNVQLAATLDACQFFSFRRMEKAIALYRELISERKWSDEPARSRLVALLAKQGQIKSIEEAIQLHNEKSAVTNKSETNDKFMQAKLLAARATASERFESDPTSLASVRTDREVAIKLLESISPKNADVADLLASQYAALGQRIRAFTSYKEALQIGASSPDRIVRFLGYWNKEFGKSGEYKPIADQYLNRLKQMPANSSDWLGLSLDRLKFLEEASENTEIASAANAERKLIGDFCNAFMAKGTAPVLSSTIHDLLAGLALSERSDLIENALEQVEAKLKIVAGTTHSQLLPSAVAASTIRLSSNQRYASRLAQWLLDHYPAPRLDSATVAREIGDAIYISGQPKLAVDYYRQAIKNDPSDINAINNLAAALAEVGGSDAEARMLSDRAVEMEPDNFERKDTKLVVAILQKDWQAAQSLSKELSGQFVGTVLLHRAMAAAEVGNLEESKVLFDRSRDAGVEKTLAVPSDQQIYQRLAKKHFNADRTSDQPIPES